MIRKQTLKDAVDIVYEQVQWRGPNGRPMGHIVITRETASVLMRACQEVLRGMGVEYEEPKNAKEADR